MKQPKKAVEPIEQPTSRGYKVFLPDFRAKEKGFQYAENQRFKHEGALKICASGFHYCTKVSHCFSYYPFDPKNIVCEVIAYGKIEKHNEDSKECTDDILIGRRLSWQEVLVLANEGKNNTGHSNSGNRNSGNRNSGDSNSGNWNSGDSNSGNWNSGNWNSGDRNSGDSNSGYRNSGYRNSGDSNSGNWNSGDRNSGDSNSGYRNSGAFCIDSNPILYLFDKPTNIRVKEWEQHRACRLMGNIDPTIWVPMSIMTDEEKKAHPKYETTEGYLKTITMKEAWANMWHNLTEDDKKIFSNLPNFDAEKFEIITGIKITP